MRETAILSAIVFLISLGCLSAQPAKAQKSQQVILAGYKQKPPVHTSGSGMVTVTLQGDTLSIEGDFKNLISPFSGAYLMVSIKGRGGNQLYQLKTELNEEKTGGKFPEKQNRFTLSEGEKELLKKGELYINITSYDHQGGELRGDINMY